MNISGLVKNPKNKSAYEALAPAGLKSTLDFTINGSLPVCYWTTGVMLSSICTAMRLVVFMLPTLSFSLPGWYMPDMVALPTQTILST